MRADMQKCTIVPRSPYQKFSQCVSGLMSPKGRKLQNYQLENKRLSPLKTNLNINTKGSSNPTQLSPYPFWCLPWRDIHNSYSFCHLPNFILKNSYFNTFSFFINLSCFICFSLSLACPEFTEGLVQPPTSLKLDGPGILDSVKLYHSWGVKPN